MHNIQTLLNQSIEYLIQSIKPLTLNQDRLNEVEDNFNLIKKSGELFQLNSLSDIVNTAENSKVKIINSALETIYEGIKNEIIDLEDEIDIDIIMYAKLTPIQTYCCTVNEEEEIKIIINLNEHELFETLIAHKVTLKHIFKLLQLIVTNKIDDCILLFNKPLNYNQEDLDSSVKYLIQLDKTLKKEVIFNNQDVTEYYNDTDHLRGTHLKLDKVNNQFSDIVHILNEYIMSKLYTDKFLKLYQMLENLMIKKHICEHTNNHGRLHLRSLKGIVMSNDTNEKDAIVALFKLLSAIKIPDKFIDENFATSSIKDYINTQIKEFYSNSHDTHLVTKLLDNMLIKNNFFLLVGETQKYECFARFIYALRNSIVHNKETEYHVLESEITKSIPSDLFNKLIFPILETIIFFVIFGNVPGLLYKNKQLSLY